MLTGIAALFSMFCHHFFIPLIFVLNLIVARNQKLQRKLRQQTLPPIISIILLVISIFSPLTILFFVKMVGYVNIVSLKSSQITSITVSDRQITDQEDISEIVSLLNRSTLVEDFRKKEKGRNETMEIHLLSGQNKYFDISFWADEENAILRETVFLNGEHEFGGVSVLVPEFSNLLQEYGVIDSK